MIQETEILLRLDDVSFYHEKTLILEHINMVMGYNQVITLIGPNGAGKTTMARLLLGLIRPSKGSVWREKRIRMGYVPQRLSIPPFLTLTVYNLLCLIQKKKRDDMMEVLERCGVGYTMDRNVHALSGGEMQRILLARALLCDPSLLILDEPMQAVDVSGQIELYELLWQLRQQRQCSIFIISHDLHIIMKKTDYVICLNRHICCEGRPEDVTQDPSFSTLFGEKGQDILNIYTHNHLGHRHGLDKSIYYNH